MFGDFWQQRPVIGAAIFSNPFDFAGAGSASSGLNLFWGSTRDGVSKLWELTELMRCDDAWYNDFLGLCRYGRLDSEM